MNDYLIKIRPFSQINLEDPFFDSLKEDYKEFADWFNKKAGQDKNAFIIESDKGIEAFLYLKREEEQLHDIEPSLPKFKRLKVGTFKVNPHGTRLGERFIKKIFDYAIKLEITQVYVTVFSKHEALTALFEKYGFFQVGVKETTNGKELVLLKNLSAFHSDILLDYPLINKKCNKYILAIYPKYHTLLFPDSMLENENYNMLQDVSHTNSIHKAYICFMDVSSLTRGDLITIYRTSDNKGHAEYRSVATSICTVEEVKSKSQFKNKDHFLEYCKKYSVFDEKDLQEWYTRSRVFVIRMLYNAAFEKRITRGDLIKTVGINREQYWGFLKITDSQFDHILKISGINESLAIDQT